MRKRILAVAAASAVALGIGGAAAMQAVAAPERPDLAGKRVICGYYNGDQKMLDAPCSKHKDPTAPDGRAAWFVGPIPVPGAAGYEDSINAMIDARLAELGINPSAAKPVPAKPAPADDDEAVAPVLKLNATPSATSVALKWTAAQAPGDDTVIGYQTRYRKTTVTTWSAPAAVANVLYRTVTGLTPGTKYQLQVRARYNTTDGYGPWSNTVTATTDDAP